MSSFKRFPILLEEADDRDIIDWLEALPSRRKSEKVRAAIRIYMAMEKGGEAPIVPVVRQHDEKPAPPRKKPMQLDLG